MTFLNYLCFPTLRSRLLSDLFPPLGALALYFVFYNFCRVHKTLGATPAMASGLVDHVLKMEDVVFLIDQREGPPKLRGPYKKRAEISN